MTDTQGCQVIGVIVSSLVAVGWYYMIKDVTRKAPPRTDPGPQTKLDILRNLHAAERAAIRYDNGGYHPSFAYLSKQKALGCRQLLDEMEMGKLKTIQLPRYLW